jgi:hypothetical protein
MKNIIFNFSKPLLTSIDNGDFFRKPVRWLYILLAFLSIILPLYLIYNAVYLNAAYHSKEEYRVKLEVVSNQINQIKGKYDTLQLNVKNFENELNSSTREYNEAVNYVNDYTYRLQYNSQMNNNEFYYDTQGQNNPQDDIRRLLEEAQKKSIELLGIKTECETKFTEAKLKKDKMKFEVDQLNSDFTQINKDLQLKINDYNEIAPAGAFYNPSSKTKAIIALVIFMLISLLVGLVNFQIFWDRKNRIHSTSNENDEFTATPVVAHYIQTIGESVGFYVAIMGFFTVLIAFLFKVCFGVYGLENFFINNLEYLSQNLSENFKKGISLLLYPIFAGFAIILSFRVIGESIKALVVIANNTKK